MANQIIYIDITFWKLGNIKFIGLSPSFLFFVFFSFLIKQWRLRNVNLYGFLETYNQN